MHVKCGTPAKTQLRFCHLSQCTDRLTTSTGHYVSGSGLGLCICKTLADTMGGSVGFRDVLPRGTLMFFRVPAQTCAASNNQVSVADSAAYSQSIAGTPTSDTPAAAAVRLLGCANITNTVQQLQLSDQQLMREKCRVLVAEDNLINQVSVCVGLLISAEVLQV